MLIGSVSSDFRDQVFGWNILLPLPDHDRDQFQTVFSSNISRPDTMTGSMRRESAHWRDISRMDDERCANLIRDDKIDILVDLALHTADNRLLVFARKPAPVQVTFMGYPGTTGRDGSAADRSVARSAGRWRPRLCREILSPA